MINLFGSQASDEIGGFLDMRPIPTIDDGLNGRHRNPVLLSEFCISHFPRNVFSANSENLLFGEDGCTALFAVVINRLVASFVPRILLIVRSGSKKQMRRVNAWRIVALMADLDAIRNIPEVDDPRSTMSTDAASSMPDSTITENTSIIASGPYPTLAGAIYKFPESSFSRGLARWIRSISARSTTKFAGISDMRIEHAATA